MKSTFAALSALCCLAALRSTAHAQHLPAQAVPAPRRAAATAYVELAGEGSEAVVMRVHSSETGYAEQCATPCVLRVPVGPHQIESLDPYRAQLPVYFRRERYSFRARRHDWLGRGGGIALTVIGGLYTVVGFGLVGLAATSMSTVGAEMAMLYGVGSLVLGGALLIPGVVLLVRSLPPRIESNDPEAPATGAPPFVLQAASFVRDDQGAVHALSGFAF